MKKNLKIGWRHRLMYSLLSKINFWQQWSKLTQKHISKFSGLVQFCLIFLLFVKCFVTDCRSSSIDEF